MDNTLFGYPIVESDEPINANIKIGEFKDLCKRLTTINAPVTVRWIADADGIEELRKSVRRARVYRAGMLRRRNKKGW